MKQKNKRIRAYAMAGTGGVVVLALFVGAILNPAENVDKRHCSIDRPPAKTLVVSLDTSDALIAVQPREIAFAVEQEIASLGKGDHIVVLDAAGKPPAEVVPIVNQCLPGDDDNVARNAFKRAVLGPVADHLADLKTHPASPESPLAETLVAIAADASLHAEKSQLVILFITDGLQNSAFQSAYRPGSTFPKLDGTPLKGVVVHLFLVKNDRDLALQPRAVEQFANWLSASGADVIYTPPAWLLMAQAKPARGLK